MTPTHLQALLHAAAAYPPWFVAVCAIIAGAFALWLVGKLLKWTLMAIIAVILVLGAAALVWLVLR